MDFLLVLEKVAIVEIWLLVEVIKINKQTIIQIYTFYIYLWVVLEMKEERVSISVSVLNQFWIM